MSSLRKFSLTTTNRIKWIVGADLCCNSPYDGHTLSTITNTEQFTCISMKDTFAGKGCRDHEYTGAATILIAGRCSRLMTRIQKKRRNSVEPKIGHLKNDNRVGRCFLKGIVGAEINAIPAAAGSN